jgi:hypothetical protein
VKLGVATGFDSGTTLDYVYRNRAEGLTPLGRLIDRNYLNAIGWRGIRLRKIHLEKLLRRAMSELHAAGEPVHIVDIAAGHGRYVLDAVREQSRNSRDRGAAGFQRCNVEAGRAAHRRTVWRSLCLRAGRRLRSGQPRRPTARRHGRHRLRAVRAVPRKWAGAGVVGWFGRGGVTPGGYLIYTGQPWHPQIEFIARVLSSHRDGKPWVMRRRSQQEMDQLVAAAGFEKIAQETDPWGIFTVSLAGVALEPGHA